MWTQTPMLWSLCWPLLAPAAGGPVVVLPDAPSTACLPEVITFDPWDLAQACDLEEAPYSRPAVATPDGVVVPYQVTSNDDGTVTLAFLPQPGVTRYLLVPDGRPPQLAGLEDELRVEETEEAVTLTNAFYRITHPKHANGGLPQRIEFVASGTRLDDFLINDRVHSPTYGGYLLRGDHEPDVRLRGAGPLAAVVEVRARYGGDAPGDPRATYRFHYFSGTPAIAVEAEMEQDGSVQWPELHLLEVNEQSGAFSRWSGGAGEGGELSASGQTYRVPEWGALIDGPNVLGIASATGVHIHDGHGAYGTYVHGPWVTWSGPRTSLSAVLWVSAAENALDDLAAFALAAPNRPSPRLTTTPIEALEATLAASGGRARMAAALAHRLAGPSLTRQRALLQQAVAAEAGGRDPREALMGEDGRNRLLEAGELALVVAATEGGLALVSLFDESAGREMCTAAQPLWTATLRLPDRQQVELRSDEGFAAVTVAVAGGTARLEWSGHPTGVTARMRVRLRDSRVATHLEIDVPDTASLMSVVPMDLHLCALGELTADDSLVYPMVSGGLATDPFRRGVRHAGRYPSGWTPIPMAAYYDPAGGLYAAWHDPLASTKDILVEGSGREVRIQMAYPAENAGVPGNGFRQPGETVIALMRGDWYDAARIYRGWAASEAQWWPNEAVRQTPQWMKEVAVWAQTWGGPEEVVEPVKAFAEYMGVPTALHWYGWHQIPFDVEYPHYFPTKPGVAEGVAELQAAGVRVMPYINGRLWDTALDDFKSTAIAAATKDEDGQYYTEEYGSGAVLAPMCPTQELWRRTVIDTVMRLCEQVGVDGVYIDQVAAADPRLCFDPSHGHPLCGGSWWTHGGYWPLLTELRQRLQSLPQEKMITTECNAEPYVHLFDGYLTWHFQYQDQIPLFAAIYGGQVQLFGRAFGGDAIAQRLKAAEALVWGEQLGWAPPSIIQDDLAGPMLRRCAQVRHALQPFLAEGEMAHPPTITGEIPRVTSDWQWGGEAIRSHSALQAGAWRDGAGRVAVIFANVLEEPLTFTWEWDGRYLSPAGASTVVTEEATQPGPKFATPGRMRITLAPMEVRAYVIHEG